MKPHYLFIVAAAATVLAVLAAAWTSAAMKQQPDRTDDNGHVLAGQWAEYEKARKSDRPLREAEILLGIRTEAMRRHLPADFYDAGTEYAASVQRRNWKLRDSVRAEFAERVREFGEPIVTYTWMGDFGGASSEERLAFMQDAGTAFSAARHPAFYRTLGGYLGGALKEFVENDREYVLWDLLRYRDMSWDEPEKDEVYAALREEIGSRYPAEPCLRYETARRRKDETLRKQALGALAADPSARAVAFHARQDLLRMRFDSLVRNAGVSADYEALRADARRFLREKEALTGADARIAKSCTDAENILEILDGKGLTLGVDGDSLVVGFRNLSEAVLTVGKQQTALTNPVRSYFAADTVKVPLPVLADGEYTFEVKSGDHSARFRYRRHTLSLAWRRTAEGLGVYVTDYRTGKPLETAKILLRKGGNTLVSETLALDGFTLLPERFDRTLKKDARHVLQASYTDGDGRVRLSPELSVDADVFAEEADFRYGEGIRANIYTDRGACHPGDTLSFKVVLFTADRPGGPAVLPETSVEIVLQDVQGDELERRILKTNEYGSAADRFVLPSGRRGGLFSLHVFSGGRRIAGRFSRVDEFILPNFTVSFDPEEKLILAGDTVRVSGHAVSYSGHSLSGARVSARVTRYGEIVSEQGLTLADDRFALTFPAEHAGYYSVEVRVTDASGETREAAAAVYVADRIRIMAEIEQAAEGECVLAGDRLPYGRDRAVMTGERFHAVLTVQDGRGTKVPVPLTYSLSDESGTERFAGRAGSGDAVDLDLASCPSGLYVFRAWAKADRLAETEEYECRVLLTRPEDTVLDAPVSRFFESGPAEIAPDGKIRVRIGTADGEQWAVATLLGPDREILSTRKLFWEGERGRTGSLLDLEWDWPAGGMGAVRLQVFYFKHGEAVTYDREYRLARPQTELPLAFSSFTDRTLPGTEYDFTLATQPGVEAVAAVYDKSLDAFGPNVWPVVVPLPASPAYVPLRSVCGSAGGYPSDLVRMRGMAKTAYSSLAGVDAVAEMADDMAVEESVSLTMNAAMAAGMPDAGGSLPVAVRERFGTVLAFQPFLRSDADGRLSFRFRTSDRLSTYYVSVYAHDKAMRNALVQEEMVVTVPVKVSVAEPAYLYSGDRYRIAVSVSGHAGQDLTDGRVRLQLYDTADWRTARPVQTRECEIPRLADGEVRLAEFDIDVDEVTGGQASVLGIMASYVCGSVSDGVFLPVPVLPAVQQLTETHAAVLTAESDREETLDRLRDAFVNVSGHGASCREISVMDKVREALPSKAEPAAGDVLSLSEAWYVRMAAGSMGVTFDGAETSTGQLLERILACRNEDGGFGWFEGMKSSPVITAVLLERFAKIRSYLPEGAADVLPEVARAAVRFLDRNQFDDEWPFWCGGLSTDRYLYVRSFWPSVPFDAAPSGSTALFDKRMKAFRKYVSGYLTPKLERGLSGQIPAKARRLRTLQNLLSEPAGVALASAWGVSSGTQGRLRKSLDADIASLLEYAVGHPSGGVYYPNAVLPFRGLLESEAYAHSMLCDLFAGLADGAKVGKGGIPAETADRMEAVADGIRLWLMLQKETQHWDEDPAFTDALHSVMQASEAVKQTRIVVMERSFGKTFPEIRAAGEGFTVVRRFFRSVGVEEKYDDRTAEKNRIVEEWQEIRPGTVLKVGDRVAAEYRIWNAENRSFVRLSAPREASLVPVRQLSGPCGDTVMPLRTGSFIFRPQGYREVHADRTDYYFDVCPEEDTVVREEFFVTRAGEFRAPVVSVESLYAPQYRANDGWTAPFISEN